MLRLSRRLGEHIQSSAQYNSPVYHSTKPSTFLAKRRRNFQQRGFFKKFLTICGYGATGVGAYVATCLVVRTVHQPTIDALFMPGEHYTLEEWRTVEPTLRPGDIILMRGSGLMSWTIATLQFVLSFMHPAALRYSHVAVVVAPAIVEYVDDDAHAKDKNAVLTPPYKVESLENMFDEANSVEPPRQTHPTLPSRASSTTTATSFSQNRRSVREQLEAEQAVLRRRPIIRRGAIILEAMDNRDFNIADITGKVTHNTVQLVEASRRIFSTTEKKVPAYHYFSVRRLANYTHTPERQEKIKRFCLDSEGRKMDGSPLYPLAFIFSKLHTLTHPLRSAVSGEVSCSELVVELYQELGVIQRHWRWVPLNIAATPSLKDNQQDEEETVPSPTPADATHDRSANSLHVYDYVYGRVNDRVSKHVMSRERPTLPDASIIENGHMLSVPELRVRSAVAPLQPTWPEVDALKEFSDFYGRTLTGEAAEAARSKLKTRMSATYVRHPDIPAPLLRAGDVVEGMDGKTYQLQWYYQHNSIATCPFHFTEGSGESVLDFEMNTGLEPEIHMRIDRPGDATAWVLEDE